MKYQKIQFEDFFFFNFQFKNEIIFEKKKFYLFFKNWKAIKVEKKFLTNKIFYNKMNVWKNKSKKLQIKITKKNFFANKNSFNSI